MLVAYARRSGLPSFSARTCAASNASRAASRSSRRSLAKPRSIRAPLSVSPSPIALAICAPSSRERHRLRVDVPIHRHDAERAQAACELSLQVPRPQDGQAARGELLRCRVVPESGADGDPVRRRRQRDGARASGVVGVEAGRAREPLERLGPVEPAVHPEERVEGFEHRQRHRARRPRPRSTRPRRAGCPARPAARPAQPRAPGP